MIPTVAFLAGFALACYLGRQERQWLLSQLDNQRKRLFECAKDLATARRHLHGDREDT